MKNQKNVAIPSGAPKYDPWRIIESSYDPAKAAEYASLFSLANGYLGIRASQEDLPIADNSYSDGIRGTFINGFYDTKPIEYGEVAYGFAENAETIQNIANPLPLELRVDGELFDLNKASESNRIVEYQRYLSIKKGYLERRIVWRTKKDKDIMIRSLRFVSFTEPHSAVMRYEVKNLSEQNAVIELQSYIFEKTMNKSGKDDPRLPKGGSLPTLEIITNKQEDELQIVGQRTLESELDVIVAVLHQSNATSFESQNKRLVYQMNLFPDKMLCLDKYMSFIDSRRAPLKNLERIVREEVANLATQGFDKLLQAQINYLANFWEHGKIELLGDAALQQGLNFSSYQLLQAAGRDGLCSVSAKGLSGEGYEGHYFWDTEMYIFVFFLYTRPQVAKAILEYRYKTLPIARERAKKMGQNRGACYPWRTISGHECSAYYPAGTAQIHINGDIALAVARYIDVTGDFEFLLNGGLEIMLETATFFLDSGHFDEDKGFVLQAVTGPDEYTTMVNNNYYTNWIAQLNFQNVLTYYEQIKVLHPDLLDQLFQTLGYNRHELLNKFQLAAEKMYFPYSKKLGISLQDDQFDQREAWNFLAVPEDHYPLLLHYHPIVIYRHRVSKQADMILTQSLVPERFAPEDLRRSFSYYNLVQTHDSSLSESIHSIMANILGQSEKAYRYFMDTALLDLENTHKNTGDGLHLANMAGTWLALTSGYAGLRTIGKELKFYPVIAREWQSYTLRINFQGCLLAIHVQPGYAEYELLEGNELTFYHYDQEVILTNDNQQIRLKLPQKQFEDQEKEIKAVIFDVDGVLLSTDEEHYKAWQRLADELGIYFDRSINEQFRGVSRRACLDILLEGRESQFTEAEKTELTTRKNNYYKENIEALDSSALLPGVLDFLMKLKELGIVIISGSSSKNARTLLQKTGIEQYFDYQVDGNDIRHSKPHPEVFLLGAQKSGIDPENCLVLEDAEAGIEAANRAGMRSVAVGNIAAKFLELGARSACFTLRELCAEDLALL